jgi:BirA family biotin operon repressor/biotin-[acetyl-CoA-carboxylase] ligase
LEIIYLSKVDSTHKFLLNKLQAKELTIPIAVVAEEQLAGIGTRGREWIGYRGNLFLSFCIKVDKLPSDLPINSASIYYAYIIKEALVDLGSQVWLKWPNDLYLSDRKIGGILTTFKENFLICSIGLNLKKSPNNFKTIDIDINKNKIIDLFFTKLKQAISWKYVFRNYRVEFEKSKEYDTSFRDGRRVLLEDALLQNDGSIILNGEKVYSLR